MIGKRDKYYLITKAEHDVAKSIRRWVFFYDQLQEDAPHERTCQIADLIFDCLLYNIHAQHDKLVLSAHLFDRACHFIENNYEFTEIED